MTKIFIIIIMLGSTVFAQDVFTLEQSLKTGLKNSKEVLIARSKFKQAESKITEARSGRLPKIAVNASYSRLSDVPDFEVSLPILPDPVTIQETVLNNYNVGVGFTQPLFTGFKLSSFQSATEKLRDAARFELIKAQNAKALEIQEAFWILRKSIIMQTLLAENVDLLKKHLQDTENYMENGLATINDVLRLKVRLANTNLKNVEAENRKELAQTLFNKSLGISLTTTTRLSSDQKFLPTQAFNLDELVNEAVNNRSELKALVLQTEAADHNVSAAQADWYPHLFAFGNYHYSNPNQRYMPLEDTFNDSWNVGVSLQWTLWDWGGRSAKTEQARQKEIQIENGYALMKEAVQTEVRKNYLDLLTQKQRILAADTFLESATENYRISTEKYNAQLLTSTELIDAEVSLYEAKTSFETAKIDYEITRVRLLKSAGRKIYQP